MRFACWMNKATDTYSAYVIHIAFRLLKLLHEGASILRHTFFAPQVWPYFIQLFLERPVSVSLQKITKPSLQISLPYYKENKLFSYPQISDKISERMCYLSFERGLPKKEAVRFYVSLTRLPQSATCSPRSLFVNPVVEVSVLQQITLLRGQLKNEMGWACGAYEWGEEGV